jgi:hypothetical protein
VTLRVDDDLEDHLCFDGRCSLWKVRLDGHGRFGGDHLSVSRGAGQEYSEAQRASGNGRPRVESDHINTNSPTKPVSPPSGLVFVSPGKSDTNG